MLDIEKICRVCLCNSTELFLMFDEKYAEHQTKVNIAMMLTEFTKYKVERFDNLPQFICAKCMVGVRKAYALKRKCEQSYQTLVNLLTENGGVQATTLSNIKLESMEQLEKFTQTEDSTLHPCERCNAKFFTFDALRGHRENAHKGSAMVCRFCSKSFNRIGYLKTHIAVFHPETGYKSHNQCQICKRQFTRREHMRRHLAVIHKFVESCDNEQVIDVQEQQTHINEAIEQQFHDITKEYIQVESISYNETSNSPTAEIETVQVLENYMYDDSTRISNKDDEDEKQPINLITTKNGEVLLKDSLADEGKTTQTTMTDKTEHIEECNTKIRLSDESSGEKFKKRGRGRPSRRPKLDVLTVEECDKDKTYVCRICAICFASLELLKAHMNSNHDTAKNMKCDICEQIFTHISQLKRHQEIKHSKKTHQCEICKKGFTAKVYLKRHLAVHGKKRFACKECSACYMTKDELKVHIKADGHDKPMLCPECGLRCKTSNVLKVHMRRHNGEKPFKCKFCSKGFPRIDDLRVHEKYHTGEKSHFCETCGKGFQRKYNLTIHLRVHSGEKPYKCPHCPQAFAQGNDLKAHIRRHTGERFRCEFCGAAFLQGYQIRQHKLTEHNVKEIPPTQRVAKFISPEEQQQQIKQNLQRELAETMNK